MNIPAGSGPVAVLRTLPGELEQSARIDGASEARIMWSIMLPLTRPALVIAGIHNAVPIWNDFFFPLVFIQSDPLKTLPQGLTVFMGEYNTDWGVLFLFGGGLTLSSLLRSSGASEVLGDQVARFLTGAHELWIILGVTTFITILTEFTSNTASAALLRALPATTLVLSITQGIAAAGGETDEGTLR